MKKPSAKKLEIFLLLALRQSERERKTLAVDADAETDEAPIETDGADEWREIFSALAAQLDAGEAEKFERLRSNYASKSDGEKSVWRKRVENSIGADEFSIDENIHRSHVEAALEKEIQAIRKIVESSLPLAFQTQSAAAAQIETEIEKSAVKPTEAARSGDEQTENNKWQNDFTGARARLEKSVRRSFVAQFVALRDLPDARVFDRLSGAQLARLARLAGIREVALACARIKAVETVAGFLRRFEPEDGRAVAAQISDLPEKISDERLVFAENIVQSALEIESEPSGQMLDWIGIRLIGVLLCAREKTAARVAYTKQKLPLETAPKLAEIIEFECSRIAPELRKKIGAEIERLAETVAKSTVKAA